jgi:hypothetical protein
LQNVVEASFGDPSGKGHLAAFKADSDATAAAGLLAFMSAAGRLSVSRSGSSSLAFGFLG